jgi:hypothetical protein
MLANACSMQSKSFEKKNEMATGIYYLPSEGILQYTLVNS